MSVQIHGECHPRLGSVRDAFAENFAEHGEVSAAVAVSVEGRQVGSRSVGGIRGRRGGASVDPRHDRQRRLHDKGPPPNQEEHRRYFQRLYPVGGDPRGYTKARVGPFKISEWISEFILNWVLSATGLALFAAGLAIEIV